jgi:hypothetical protein
MCLYLNNPKNQVTGDDCGIFNKTQSKTEIAKAIANLFQTPEDLYVDANDIIVPAKPEIPDQRLLRLQERLIYFETVNIRGKYLGPFLYLSTIQATSVESERAFSVIRLFCTKIHSSLNDETLEDFCLLLAHF